MERHEELELLMTPLLQSLAHVINDATPEEWGFALVLFPFDDKDKETGEGSLLYVSNAQRDDMMRCFKEVIAKMEKEAAETPDADEQ